MPSPATPTIRGQRKLFSDIFSDQPPVAELSTSDIKETRNECLIDYFYYLGRKKIIVQGKEVNMKYDDLVKLTASAFFLAPHTVFNILNANGFHIALVKQQWKETDAATLQLHMKSKWPMFVWM